MCRYVCPAAKKKVLQKFSIWTKRHTIIINLIKLNKFKPSFANLESTREKDRKNLKRRKMFGERKVKKENKERKIKRVKV